MEDHFQRAQDAEIFDGHLHCGTDRDEFMSPLEELVATRAAHVPTAAGSTA
jgi:hypothetical protein